MTAKNLKKEGTMGSVDPTKISSWAQQILNNFTSLRRPAEIKDGVLYTNIPVDVTISFKSGDTSRTNLGGFFKVNDAASLSTEELQELFKDTNSNGIYDGIEKGILQPLYDDSTHVNGRWLEALSPTFYTETKEVTYPLDIEFLVDTTGSFGDDIRNFKTKADEIVTLLKETVPDVRFALSDFRDFSKYPYGGSGDYPYNKDLDFTTDESVFKDALSRLSIGWGADGPEAQLEALYRSIDSLDWRKDAVKIIALSTDAPFHNSETEPAYPGAGYSKVVDALRKNGIEVLSLYSGWGYGESDSKRIAEDTGGEFYKLSTDSREIVDKLKEGVTKIIEEKKATYEKLTGGETIHLDKGDAIVFYLASGDSYDEMKRDSILFSNRDINGILASRVEMLSPKEYNLYWEDAAAVGGDGDFDDVVLSIKLEGEGLDKNSYSTGREALIAKRSLIGNSVKTIIFGDTSVTVNVPVLDTTELVNLNFGKYERLMPNGTKLIVTAPLGAISKTVAPTEETVTESIEIVDPGKPVRPNKADFIDPETGELDKEAYNAAKVEYRKALATYKAALKEYKAAVKAVKLEAKGQTKSLKVEEKAIKTVNRALTKLVKGEQKADKYVTKAEVSLGKAANYRTLAKELRAEANERATALLGEGWTMEDLEAKLIKPNKADFIDPKTGEFDKDAYNAAKAEYKEAKAIAKLFKKADKYDLKADKLEVKAELYQQKALDITAKTVDRFKSTLESLIAKYTGKAESLKATGEALLKQAESLEGADYYKALGKGKYSVELAEGYERGAEIATAVLETYVNVDVSVNPDVADSLESVDISNLSVNI